MILGIKTVVLLALLWVKKIMEPGLLLEIAHREKELDQDHGQQFKQAIQLIVLQAHQK